MSRAAVAVAALAGLGAALRLAGLDAKGFWEDEALTVALLRGEFGGVASEVIDSQRLPPLYFLAAWPWAQAFGEGEVGLRSLSVLFGVATIPVAYLAGRELVSRRAGLLAAALVAVNPLLVWYSQEARPYALLVLLSGIALYFFAHSIRDPRPWPLALWAVSSALAMVTHYFAGFLFVAEAAWLVRRLGPRRPVLAAVALPGATALALIPLAATQQDPVAGNDWITEISLLNRIVQIPGSLLVGFEVPYPLALVLAAGAAILAGVGLYLLLAKGSPDEHRGALIAGSVAAAGLLIPLGLAPLGIDVLLYRNVLGVALPLAVVLAAGLGAARAGAMGIAAAAALLTLSAGIVLATASEPKYQRDAWREAAQALGSPSTARAIVLTPGAPGRTPLQVVYLVGASDLREGTAVAEEIDLLALPRRELGEIANATLPELDRAPPPPAPGFTLVEERRGEHYVLYRYRGPRPRTLSVEGLMAAGIGEHAEPRVLVQRPG